MGSPTVFVVRVWIDSDQFRASARLVDESQAGIFTSPLALLTFLLEHPPSPPQITPDDQLTIDKR